jgi:DNA-binding transcriptional LysR family regulator
MREACPHVTFSVILAYSGDLRNLMDNGRPDIALTYRPRVVSNVDCIKLFSEWLVLVSGHARQVPGQRRSLGSIAGLRLILPSRIHELRRIIDRVCAMKGVRLNPALELDMLDAVKTILIGKPGQYHSILPCHSIKSETEVHRLGCVAFEEQEMQRTIAIVIPKGSRRPPAFDGLVAHICEKAEQLKQKLDALF